MGKRPESLESALLAIEMLRRIPRGRKITVNELHDQLAEAGFVRDVRTIQRQIETLSEYFHLERDDRSKPYGYRWPQDSRGFSLPNLTLQESLLLRLAEEHLRNLLPARLMKSMEGFFVQARQNMGPAGPDSLEREWPSKVRVVPTNQPLLPPSIGSEVFDAVCDALYGNFWLNVDYKNAAGIESKVEVMPLGLAQQGPRLYLVCRYKGYENERMLALNRMRAARPTTLTFKRPKNFDLKRFDEDGRFGFGEGKRIRLTFRIDKHEGLVLLESPLSPDQQVKEIGDHYEITATVVDSDMLDRWLRGFGESVWKIRKKPAIE